jgi:hypothetical protein
VGWPSPRRSLAFAGHLLLEAIPLRRFLPILFGRIVVNKPWLAVGAVGLGTTTVTAGMRARRVAPKRRYRTPDAIHLASAEVVGADAFVSNDERLRGSGNVRVVTLGALTGP